MEECFVLCDAGGGTVVSIFWALTPAKVLTGGQDVVSYRVTQLEPTLELEQVAIPYSKHFESQEVRQYTLTGSFQVQNAAHHI